MGYLTDLTDEQWALIEPIIPPLEGPGRRRTVDLRRVIDALMGSGRVSNGMIDIPTPVPQNALQIDGFQVACVDIQIIAPDE